MGRAGGTAGVGELFRQTLDEGRERREPGSDPEARQPRASNALLPPGGEARRIVDGQRAVAIRSRESKCSVGDYSVELFPCRLVILNNNSTARVSKRLNSTARVSKRLNSTARVSKRFVQYRARKQAVCTVPRA